MSTSSLQWPTIARGVLVVAIWAVIMDAQTAARGDDALVDTILAAMRAREHRLLESGALEATLELTEENEKEPMYDEQGQMTKFGSGLGTVRSRITYAFKDWKWRLNMEFLEGTHFDGHKIVDLPRGKVSKEFSLDGIEARYLDRLTGHGVISKPSVVEDGSLTGNVFLPGEYWLVWDNKPLSASLDQPGNPPTVDKDPDGNKPSVIVLRSAAVYSGVDCFLRVSLNADYGYAVEKVAYYQGSERWPFKACQVARMHEVEPGLWIPAEWKYSTRNPSDWTREGLYRTYRLVDAKLVAEVDDATFGLEFPTGTLLSNNVTQNTERVGPPKARSTGDWVNIGRHLQQILPEKVVTTINKWWNWFIVANTVLAALLGWRYLRRRSPPVETRRRAAP